MLFRHLSSANRVSLQPAVIDYFRNNILFVPFKNATRAWFTRYRIEAETWKIYDKAEPSYWEFPRGIYLEKFNEDMMVEASLRADYAVYKEVEQIWHLVGNVHALNEEQEQFDTPEMFWNQKTERVYSDSSIVITREASIIQGVGFESNQSMTNYVILHPTGFFPIEE